MTPALSLRSDVVALFVDPRGPYPRLVVDWYDEARDARTYAGPHPVVAHPPCGPWGPMRHLSAQGGKDLGPHAIDCARKYGGVVEQPIDSRLFSACGVSETALIRVEQVSSGAPLPKTDLALLFGRSAGLRPFYDPARRRADASNLRFEEQRKCEKARPSYRPSSRIRRDAAPHADRVRFVASGPRRDGQPATTTRARRVDTPGRLSAREGEARAF